MRTFNHGLRRRRFGVRRCQGVLCLGEIWQINFSIAVLQSQLCWNVVGTKLLKWKKLINEALDDFLFMALPAKDSNCFYEFSSFSTFLGVKTPTIKNSQLFPHFQMEKRFPSTPKPHPKRDKLTI